MPRITDKQSEILDTLKIERLSSDIHNLRLVSNFRNLRNESLTNTLQSEAFEDDEEGKNAYYLIKNPKGDILFYFSLKCGQLYDHFFENGQLELIGNLIRYFDEIENDPETGEEDLRIIHEIKEHVRINKGISKAELQKISKKDNKAIKDLEESYTGNLQRVGQTFSGLEIVQFCVNENERDYLDSLIFFPRFGAIVFWRFIVPIVKEVTKHVGCQYLFLFAADTSEDESLIKYYKTLKFKDDPNYSTAIPFYDWTCHFMYQEIKELEEGAKQFFDNFNPGEEDV
jgi:uncharacterized Rmd1/YagE family protein